MHRADVRRRSVPEPVRWRRLGLVYHLLCLHIVHLDVVALPFASDDELLAPRSDPRGERVADELEPGFFAPLLDDPILARADAEGHVAEAGDDALVPARVDDGVAFLGDGDQAASLALVPGAEQVERDRGSADFHGPAAHDGAGGHLDDLGGLVVPGHREPSTGRVVARGDDVAVAGLARAAASLGDTPRALSRSPSRVHREGFLGAERGPPRRLGHAHDPELIADDEPQPPLGRVVEHVRGCAFDSMRRARVRRCAARTVVGSRCRRRRWVSTGAAAKFHRGLHSCGWKWFHTVAHTRAHSPWTTAFTRSAATGTCASTAPRGWVRSACDARRRRYPRRTVAKAAAPTAPPSKTSSQTPNPGRRPRTLSARSRPNASD